MAMFRDRNNHEWQINLDPVVCDEIKQSHGIEIVNLERDPMLTLRSDPMKLVSVIHMLCQDQISAKNLTPEQFAKVLPFPPDAMIEAVEDSIVNFFPTGRHSHIREVLASYAEMANKTDELTTAKMQSVTANPKTMQMLSDRADREIQKAMQELSETPGT